MQRKTESLRVSDLESKMLTFRPEGISEREVISHARLYAEDVWRVKLPISDTNDRELTFEEQQKLLFDLQAYQEGKPIQYIIGKASFYGILLNVTPSVLIPRQETEELVHKILKDHPQPYARVLDIGTGSGCIAIALQHHRPVWYMQAMDVSEDALIVAESNAKACKVEVYFLQADILKDELNPPIPFDMIVSNPPYIPTSEKEWVGTSTQQYEPALALWTPDDDPLLYYRVIAEKAITALKPCGLLYFEINEFRAAEVGTLLHKLGYTDIRIFDDLSDKPRMVSAKTTAI